MNKEEDYATDSDQSDEDFCPEKETANAEAVSEDDSDIAEEEDYEASTDKEQKTTKGKRKRQEKKQSKRKEQPTDEVEKALEESSSRPTTRHMEGVANKNEKDKHEKDELESDDEDKTRKDALWADFLGDVKQPTTSKKKEAPAKTTTNGAKTELAKSHANDIDESKEKLIREKPQKVTVTEICDFAGEEVRIQKTINADSIKENKANATTTGIAARVSPAGLKRPGNAGGGLGSILNQIGKKKKISVLEKSQLDWKSFKQDEGIEEELHTFNKGKDGFLERQDFLQRTDLRQFEIEKNLRQSRRNN